MDCPNAILCHFVDIRTIAPEAVPDLTASLPPLRREKVLSLKAEGRRLQSLAAGLASRRVLASVGLSDALLRWEESGKPYIQGHPDWHVSISHSGDYAVCVLSRTPAAVDIQRREGVKEALFRRCYSLAEQAYCNAAPDRERAFYDLWCRKECKAKLRSYPSVREIDALSAEAGFRYWDIAVPGYSCTLYGAADCGVVTEGLS